MTMLIVGLVVVVVGVLILRAMHTKGDVKAMFKGPLVAFSLEAKDRKRKTKTSRPARRPGPDQ
jgi:hypothetical protein